MSANDDLPDDTLGLAKHLQGIVGDGWYTWRCYAIDVNAERVLFTQVGENDIAAGIYIKSEQEAFPQANPEDIIEALKDTICNL